MEEGRGPGEGREGNEVGCVFLNASHRKPMLEPKMGIPIQDVELIGIQGN